MHSWSSAGTRCLLDDLLFLRFTKDCASGRDWGEAWEALAVDSPATQVTSQVSSPVRAVTQAQRTAARAQATTRAAPGCLEPSGLTKASHQVEEASHLAQGLLLTLQLDPIEDPTTSPHPHVQRGPLCSTQLPPEPPSLALEEEEARRLRLEVPSSPLMLSLWVLEHITKVEATTQVAARVDLIVAHQA